MSYEEEFMLRDELLNLAAPLLRTLCKYDKRKEFDTILAMFGILESPSQQLWDKFKTRESEVSNG